jgi:hypothetical protein
MLTADGLLILHHLLLRLLLLHLAAVFLLGRFNCSTGQSPVNFLRWRLLLVLLFIRVLRQLL